MLPCLNQNSGNMMQQKMPLKRQGNPKSKNGCLSCKKRRIKCDEGRPQCQRCLKSCLRCEGYALTLVPTRRALLLLPAPLVSAPDNHISTDPEERRYFYLYCQDTAAILSGQFYSNFWSKLVPQSGWNAKPIRHAVAAVTALLKLLESSSRSPLRIDDSKRRDQMYHFFVRQYSQAVISLRHLLATKGSHHKIALIASILFISIESLQGDLVTASQHIFSAFSMAAEANTLNQSRSKYLPIDDELFDMLVGLEIQSKLPNFYAPVRPQNSVPTLLSTISLLPAPSIHTSFETASSAKTSLDSIIHSISYYHTKRPKMLESRDAASKKHLTLLKEWEAAFLALDHTFNQSALARGSHTQDYKSRIAHRILASTHALALIIVKSDAARCSEMFYDTLKPHFQCIIDCSKVVLDAMSSNPLPNFVFEVGLLPPLHITAMKCRIPALRREAISLLRAFPGQEGVWEGYGCAEACEWIMTIEESGAASESERSVDPMAEDARLIPEWDRVRLSSMVCWLNESRIWAQCTSVLPVARGSHQVWERTFRW